jgi:hypothetical protein
MLYKIYNSRMPLDPVAQRYAHTLFVDRLEELSRNHLTRSAEVRAGLAGRGILPHTAGHYHSEMTRIGIEYIGEIANAKVDSLLAAYSHAKLPIDDRAVEDINRDAVEWTQAQGRNLTANIRQQVEQASMPSGIADQMAATITSGISGVNARILRRLSAKRDEEIMAGRTVPQPEKAPPSEVRPTASNWAIQVWHKSAKWQWYGGFFAAAFLMISIQEYFFGDLLLFPSALSLLSKLVHWNGRVLLKWLGSVGILCACAVFLYIVWALKGAGTWSHLQTPLAKIVGSWKKSSFPLPTAPAPAVIVQPNPPVMPPAVLSSPPAATPVPKATPGRKIKPLVQNSVGKKSGSGSGEDQTGKPLSPSVQINNAPNGIAIGGGIVNNPTVWICCSR